jgi:uncharacterized protein YcfL
MISRVVVLSLVLFTLSGCSTLRKLPAINAEEFVYERHDPAGGTKITAKNVKADPKKGDVSADEVSWITSYPMISISITAKGYSQSRETEDVK